MSIIELISWLLFIIVITTNVPCIVKVLTLGVEIFLTLTELLLHLLIVDCHSFLRLIISFLLITHSLFNHSDSIIVLICIIKAMRV
jgi:hypothetical protein